jgi:hypothetical protein
MFQKALTHIDNVGDPNVWMQVGKMYDLIKNNKVTPPSTGPTTALPSLDHSLERTHMRRPPRTRTSRWCSWTHRRR